jgi:hypothetical protein
MAASSGSDYRIGADEVILLKEVLVGYGRKTVSAERFEAVLTNRRLMVFKLPMFFGSSKQVVAVAISQIKVFNDQAQAILSNRTEVEVHHFGGAERLRFETRAAASKWTETINLLATGREDEVVIDDGSGRAIPGAEYVSEMLRDTVGTFKGVFGGKAPTTERKPIPMKAAGRCNHCGGPIQGYKGRVVTCAHCGHAQQLGESEAAPQPPPPPAWASTTASVPGPPPGAVPAPIAEPGWKSDPRGRHEYRWWDGTTWTTLVADHGVTGNDPL